MYLIYAEALLKSKNDLPGAIEQVNKVRARVGLGDLAVCNPGKNLTTDADALLEEILRERAWRKYALVRKYRKQQYLS